MKILMVLTSHDKLGNTGRKTGFWLEEFAAPYFTFLDAGAAVTLASPKGGQPPIDPVSDTPEGQTDSTRRFKQRSRGPGGAGEHHAARRRHGRRTTTRSSIPGATARCGTWPRTRARSPSSRRSTTPASRSPPSATRPACSTASSIQGQPLVKGKRVTGFTNGEEEAVHLTKVVPFLVEDELKRLGGLYEKAADWESFVVTDGRLVTGQNPASSRAGAEALLRVLA